MEVKSVRLNIPEGCNIILGQTHFIKTVEDLYEILVGSVPNIQFGIAFNEASGPCLVRKEGNEPELVNAAVLVNATVPPPRTVTALLPPVICPLSESVRPVAMFQAWAPLEAFATRRRTDFPRQRPMAA